MKINMGCGRDIKEGYTNVDIIKNKGVDVIHNLNEYPYPFEDSSVDEIYARDIMEHLDNPNKFIRELWIIGKKGCKIKIITPHFSSMYAWNDLTHKRPFGYFVFNHYDCEQSLCNDLNMKTPTRFDVKAHLNFGWAGMFGTQWLFNKFPYIYERYLCHIFPCADVSFDLEVKK